MLQFLMSSGLSRLVHLPITLLLSFLVGGSFSFPLFFVFPLMIKDQVFFFIHKQIILLPLSTSTIPYFTSFCFRLWRLPIFSLCFFHSCIIAYSCIIETLCVCVFFFKFFFLLLFSHINLLAHSSFFWLITVSLFKTYAGTSLVKVNYFYKINCNKRLLRRKVATNQLTFLYITYQ